MLVLLDLCLLRHRIQDESVPVYQYVSVSSGRWFAHLTEIGHEDWTQVTGVCNRRAPI